MSSLTSSSFALKRLILAGNHALILSTGYDVGITYRGPTKSWMASVVGYRGGIRTHINLIPYQIAYPLAHTKDPRNLASCVDSRPFIRWPKSTLLRCTRWCLRWGVQRRRTVVALCYGARGSSEVGSVAVLRRQGVQRSSLKRKVSGYYFFCY